MVHDNHIFGTSMPLDRGRPPHYKRRFWLGVGYDRSTPRADLQAATSALRPISSASLQGADLLADRAVRRFFLRVVGRLPWLCDCREFVRQASDKPQGRKPRAVWSGLCRLSGLWRFNRTICSPDLTAARIDGPSSPRFSRRRSSTRSSPTPTSKTRASA